MQNNENNTVASKEGPTLANAELERRELVRKLGKFALYAAPFTVLARTNRAEAASGGGPGQHPFRHP